MKPSVRELGLVSLLCTSVIASIPLDLSSEGSIRNAASIAAAGMVTYYNGSKPGETPGLLPKPYYWWQAGSMFGSLVDYWYYTGDSQYNNITTQALLYQTGDHDDYMPTNQSKELANDDQAFWAFAAMNAAEYNYPSPPEGKPSWATLAQNVFNSQAARWQNDTNVCGGGGLKWQIYPFNAGYNLRNAISNGMFFTLGSRLALFTGNHSYADWAERSWNWTSGVGLIDSNYTVWDSTDDSSNCSFVQHFVWSINAGVFLAGAASMYNFTNGSSVWEERTRGLVTSLQHFLDDHDILIESACEQSMPVTCTVEQKMFKGHLLRFIATAITRAPLTEQLLKPIVNSTAYAVPGQCGRTDVPDQQCTFTWSNPFEDVDLSVSAQMNALQAFQTNLLFFNRKPLYTAATSSSNSSQPSGKSGSGTSSSMAGRIVGESRLMLVLGFLTGAILWFI